MATGTGTGTGTGRDARRRRIVERGSDRLALITGKIQTLPSPPTPSPPDAPSSPPFLAGPDQPHPSDVSHRAEDKLSETFLQKVESSFDGKYTDEDTSELPAFKDQASPETSQLPDLAVDTKSETAPSPSMSRSVSRHSPGDAHPSNLPANLLKLINPNQISSAIATSTGTRLLCSLIGGLLVVLSSIGFPLLGSRIMRSVLTFRPLYLILLTNMTIIASHLMSYKQGDQERAAREENRTPANDESGWVDQVGTSLELGFLVMKVIDAVVMDCSLYAVVVVCGLSLFQKFV